MSTPVSPARDALIAAVQAAFSRFQSATDAMDEIAADVLGLSQRDMFCIEILFRVGAMRVEELGAATGLGRGALKAVIDRVERAGYARRVPGAGRAVRIELTEHARQWIETIWGPIGVAGGRLIAGCRTGELRFLLRFLEGGLALQEAEAARIRALLDTPAEPPRRSRGGLSPAALRRVQLYVQANLANLDRPLRVADLARRARLSTHHFARAFKASTGETPRAFIERMRVERAAALLRESDQALAQVALASGFGTQSRMTTVFRKATGMTPARYRRDR